ncbi:Phage head-tail joining protein [compost metagenome]
MRAGLLNRSVALLTREDRRNAANELIGEWVEVVVARASIRHTSGLSAIKAGAELAIVKASVRIRYRRDVAAGMRVRHGADFYLIEAVLPDEMGRDHVDLACRLLSEREV